MLGRSVFTHGAKRLVIGVVTLAVLALPAIAAATPPSPSPQVWSPPFTAAAASEMRSMTAGPAGSVYAAGTDYLSIADRDTMVLARLRAADGMPVWQSAGRGPQDTGAVPLDLATLPSNHDLIVAGLCHQSANPDAYVARLAAGSGRVVWHKRWDGAAHKDDQASAVAVDRSGNVYAAGTSGTSGSRSDAVVLKYDKNGVFKWRYLLKSTREDGFWDCAVDGAGNVYVTGDYASDWHTTGKIVTTKISPAGRMRWRSTVYAPGWVYSGRFLRLRGGSLYVGGTRRGGSTKAMVIKYSLAGKLLWKGMSTRVIDDNGGFADMTVDAKGRIFAVGSFSEAPPALPAGGGWIEVWRPGGSGTVPMWQTVFTHEAATPSDVHEASLSAIVVDSIGRIYCAGSWDSLADGAGSDAVVARYAPSGASAWTGPDRVWTHDGTAGAADGYYGLLRVSDGAIYAAGYESYASPMGRRGLVSRPQTTAP